MTEHKYPADIIETVAKAIHAGMCEELGVEVEEDDDFTVWNSAAVAALDALGIEFEYSIAYPHRDGWDTDGAECYETFAEAEEELNSSNYLDTDRVVSRRKASPWVEVAE